MNWEFYLHQFQDFVLSSPSDPPYFLFFSGLLISLTSGVAFAATLKQQLGYWSKNLSPDHLPKWGKLQLTLPFVGTAIGICLSLGAAMEIIGLPFLLAYSLSVLFTILVSLLGWSQIGKALGRQLVRSYLSQYPAK
ncbi:MAG: hypothetical protein VKJ46_07125 [Leptolyngbyaceae bacterium]|nr:hypothetical protein [Leptolyngbyaceae bacterium]